LGGNVGVGLNLEFTCARDSEALHSPERKTATMSHMSSRVPPNLRVQLFRLFSRNPHDSCIPCKEKHGLQCCVRSPIAMIKSCHNAMVLPFRETLLRQQLLLHFTYNPLHIVYYIMFTGNDMHTFRCQHEKNIKLQ